MTTPEGTIKAYLKKRVRELGGEVRFVQWIGRANAPDCLVMIPGLMPRWVETKRPSKDAEKAQLREHERMRACGMVVHVADTTEAIDAIWGCF